MIQKKQNKKLDTFGNLLLDEYEKEIKASIARGEWKSVDNFKSVKKTFEEAAHHHIELRKSKSVTFRINQVDLIKLKARAKKKSIPYQTLLTVLIRDFISGDYAVKL